MTEQRVFELHKTREYSVFLVEGDTKTYHVHLWQDGTKECTCPYWTYRRKPCSHILASYLYSHPLKPDEPEADEPKQTEAELERIVAGVPDIFDPETWR